MRIDCVKLITLRMAIAKPLRWRGLDTINGVRISFPKLRFMGDFPARGSRRVPLRKLFAGWRRRADGRAKLGGFSGRFRYNSANNAMILRSVRASKRRERKRGAGLRLWAEGLRDYQSPRYVLIAKAER
ncbi:hypothetical protein PAPH110629_10435 [Paenibacillus phoenicis]